MSVSLKGQDILFFKIQEDDRDLTTKYIPNFDKFEYGLYVK